MMVRICSNYSFIRAAAIAKWSVVLCRSIGCNRSNHSFNGQPVRSCCFSQVPHIAADGPYGEKTYSFIPCSQSNIFKHAKLNGRQGTMCLTLVRNLLNNFSKATFTTVNNFCSTQCPQVCEKMVQTTDSLLLAHPESEMDLLQSDGIIYEAVQLERPASRKQKHLDDKIDARPTLIRKPAKELQNQLTNRSLWIYSNDIENHEVLRPHAPCIVNVKSSHLDMEGVALYEIHPILSARILDFNGQTIIDESFFDRLFIKAMHYRIHLIQCGCIVGHAAAHSNRVERTFEGTEETFPHFYIAENDLAFRLVESDADYLSGVTVNVLGPYLWVNIFSKGLILLAESLKNSLQRVFHPKGILMAGEFRARYNHGLPLLRNVCAGEVPRYLSFNENGCKFTIDTAQCPSVGWYTNRRNLRQKVYSLCKDKNVLDLFSYVGGFGIQCAKLGYASKVTCVEWFEKSVEMGRQCVIENNLVGKVEFIRTDAVQWLQDCITSTQRDETYDVVILDPPSDYLCRETLKCKPLSSVVLLELLVNAIKLTSALGYIAVTSSLLVHNVDTFKRMALEAATKCHRHAIICGEGGPSEDHPVSLNIPKSNLIWVILEIKDMQEF